MSQQEEEKLAKILANGGEIIMHKNDYEKLMSIRACGLCSSFDSVTIHKDKYGFVTEGSPIAFVPSETLIHTKWFNP